MLKPMASCERVFLNVSDTDGDEGKMAHQTKSLIVRDTELQSVRFNIRDRFPTSDNMGLLARKPD
jgi:hypothetical protein